MTFEQILQLILGSTGAVVVLIMGIKWLDKDRNRIMLEWKEERDGRLKQIEHVNQQCVEDRVELHKKADSLELEVRSLLKTMLGHNFNEDMASQRRFFEETKTP